MAVVRSKRYKKRAELVDANKRYNVAEAIAIVKQVGENKYDESVAVNFQLGIKPTSSEEMVRGTVALPHGSGKDLRVVCVCKGEPAKQAAEAGANEVGAEELIEKISKGWLDFDAVVAHPDMMRELSKLGRVLGPRGLMPSPKAGTVTPNVGQAVKELKAGKIEFKSDKTGGLHAICGKISFDEGKLVENTNALIQAVRDAKPAAAKGDYFRKVSLSVTHGPGIKLAVGI